MNWYDVVLTLVYSSHLFFPLAFAFFLWLRWRNRYYPFVGALMLTRFAAFERASQKSTARMLASRGWLAARR